MSLTCRSLDGAPMTLDDAAVTRDRVKAAYGGNWDRLVPLENRYDPHNCRA